MQLFAIFHLLLSAAILYRVAMLNDYIKRILDARVYDVAVETPLEPANTLSGRLDNRIWLKREDLQPVFSFKLRGAYNKMAQLTAEERARGVIAASAGNHAQGVALSAARLGLDALIVMPKTTPEIKVAAVESRGARTELHGDAYDEAYLHARQIAEERGMTFIHPYDDPDVIAGQGTVAMEILRQHQGEIDAIFVPVGGGGLIAGVAAYIKYLRPETRVIGVEPEDAPCMHHALEAGERVILDQVGIFADCDRSFIVVEAQQFCRVLGGHLDCGAERTIREGHELVEEPAQAGLELWRLRHPPVQHVAIRVIELVTVGPSTKLCAEEHVLNACFVQPELKISTVELWVEP